MAKFGWLFNNDNMKKIFSQWQLGLLALVVTSVTSCEREQLDDVMSKESYSSVSMSLASKADIGTGSNFNLTSAELKVPVTINFSSPTTRAFVVQLSANTDTVAKLIADQVLPAGTVRLTEGAFTIPTVLNVPIGVSSATFDLAVSRSFIEINYGKNIAVALKIANPAKGNSVASGKNAVVVAIKTDQVVDESTVRSVSFGTETAIHNVSLDNFALKGSEDVTISVPLKLQGDPGVDFTVDAVVVPDSVTKYINNGTLKNSVLFPASSYSILNPKVRFEVGKSTAVLTITTKVTTLYAMMGKNPTIGITLKNPSKFQVANRLHTSYVVIDQGSFRPYYGVPFLVKGAINAVSDPIYAAYYDFGGEGIAFHDDNGKDGAGDWRAPDKVDVSHDYNPRTVVGWTNAGEWLTWTILVEETGTYEMDMYFGANNADGRYRVFLGDQDLTGEKSAINTGSHGDQRSHKSTVTLTKGRHILKLLFIRGNHDYRGVIFTRKS